MTYSSLQRQIEERIARRQAIFNLSFFILSILVTWLLAMMFDWRAPAIVWGYWTVTFLSEMYRRYLDKGEPRL